MRAPEPKRVRRTAPAQLAARLQGHVTLDAHASGELVAYVDNYPLRIGRFSTAAVERAGELRKGLPFASFSTGRKIEKEIDLLVRRLAESGLLEYCLVRAETGETLAVIEPQVEGYWPQMPQIGTADRLVLSRFAYMRRRASDLVLESPRAGALFKICNPKIAALLASLSVPQKVKALCQQEDFPSLELLALLLDCGILFKANDGDDGLRLAEGDQSLVLWDFHDLLFHTRSTEGRHANPIGGIYPYAGVLPPPSALRPSWPGKKIDLSKAGEASAAATLSPFVKLLRSRVSTRIFDNQHPITLAELSRFLDGAARVLSVSKASPDIDDGGHAIRPYPSAGAAYELELYLAADKCEGLARGFYHYDAGLHALVPIKAQKFELDALLAGSQYAMGSPAPPQILITIAARFGRASWKYSSIAYSLILKDAGVLLQTFYLMATEMGLGGCASGITNIDLFAKMTGIAFHMEGPVGQFSLGRGVKPSD